MISEAAQYSIWASAISIEAKLYVSGKSDLVMCDLGISALLGMVVYSGFDDTDCCLAYHDSVCLFK